MWRRVRLRARGDFVRLRQHGRTFHHAALLLNIGKNSLSHNRYGFVTGRRLGGAVTRNRVRRRLREAARHLHPQLRQGFDVVFVAKPALVQQPYDEVLRHITWLCEQADLLRRDV